MQSVTRAVVTLALVSLLVAGAPIASGQTPTDTTSTVALQSDGNATVTVTYAFDLETSTEAAAFDELEADTTARERLASSFQTDMNAVADNTASQTNRSMSVHNATVSFDRTDTVGEASVRVEWVNLARVTDDDQLTLAEPFSASFTPDGTFRVIAPAGHTITSATPAPASQTATTATWDANATLDGFAVRTAPADETGDDSVSTPGFTAGLAALAVLVAALLIARQ